MQYLLTVTANTIVICHLHAQGMESSKNEVIFLLSLVINAWALSWRVHGPELKNFWSSPASSRDPWMVNSLWISAWAPDLLHAWGSCFEVIVPSLHCTWEFLVFQCLGQPQLPQETSTIFSGLWHQAFIACPDFVITDLRGWPVLSFHLRITATLIATQVFALLHEWKKKN
jgi:hypothetical protein